MDELWRRGSGRAHSESMGDEDIPTPASASNIAKAGSCDPMRSPDAPWDCHRTADQARPPLAPPLAVSRQSMAVPLVVVSGYSDTAFVAML